VGGRWEVGGVLGVGGLVGMGWSFGRVGGVLIWGFVLVLLLLLLFGWLGIPLPLL